MQLFEHQLAAIEKLSSGKILCGGVGTGKSLTALGYYYIKICGGSINPFTEMINKIPLYIITTARKRDTEEWSAECLKMHIFENVTVDSWNNIAKYANVKNAFFIFDEQRVVGYGTWVKNFFKICRENKWILLTATPGDTWTDYMPVFIANGFYKNKTEFIDRHVVYDMYSSYPRIKYYVNTDYLVKLKEKIMVNMYYEKHAQPHEIYISSDYNESLYKTTQTDLYNPFKKAPIRNASELCYVLREIVNKDDSKLIHLDRIYRAKKKVIVFYNFNYELEMLKNFAVNNKYSFAEWNGHLHESIPDTDEWLYFVQYSAGAEGWNCILTNTLVFFSMSYSYKQTIQAAGRIDRLNTPYDDLYYYYIKTNSSIDKAIEKTLKRKEKFNANSFVENSLDIKFVERM